MKPDSKSIQVVTPGTKATVEQIGALAAETGEKLKKGRALRFDVSRVEQADLSFIQLLYAAQRSAEAEGKSVEFTGKLAPSLVQTLVDGGFIPEKVEEAGDLVSALIDFRQ